MERSVSASGLRDGTDESVRRVLAGASEISRPMAVGLVSGALLLSWAATYGLGGAGTTAPHWFYFPILFAATRFGVPGALVAAGVSGVLAGPLMPDSVSTGSAQPVSDWVSRAGFFVAIGTVMALLVERTQAAIIEERKLVDQQQAVIQSVTHEFRTPLTVIHGAVELVERGDLDPDALRQFLTMLHTASERLTDLVDLVISSAQSGGQGCPAEGETADLGATIDAVVTSLARHGAHQRVRIRLEPRIVVAGPTRLVAICLRAVIENALKFSPAASAVTVDAEPADGRIEVRVRDRGEGMDPAVARRSIESGFAPTRATATVGGGLGLGLFAAARAVEQLDGEMWIEPDVDGGTRVVLLFPSPKS